MSPIARPLCFVILTAASIACSSNDSGSDGDVCARAVAATNACSGSTGSAGSTCDTRQACQAQCILSAPTACDYPTIARCVSGRCENASVDSGVGGGDGATVYDSGSGSDDTTDPGGTSAWRCADNGANCLCYDPAPTSGYTLPACPSSYTCCWADEGGGEQDCECVTTGDCGAVDHGPTAVRVAHCPP